MKSVPAAEACQKAQEVLLDAQAQLPDGPADGAVKDEYGRAAKVSK